MRPPPHEHGTARQRLAVSVDHRGEPVAVDPPEGPFDARITGPELGQRVLEKLGHVLESLLLEVAFVTLGELLREA